MPFQLVSEYEPTGDQPEAIEALVRGIQSGLKYQTLLGATGTGKTFTIANVIARVGKPTLVISPNKTLAAQLYGEFKQFFPHNAVEFFISYYDYYQPEAYLPATDTYIEKDFAINEEIDRLRLRATSALLSGRDDVIVVASVSCIYGLGSPEDYRSQIVTLRRGEELDRNELLLRLIHIFYTRSDGTLEPGTFRVRGDVVEVFPAYEDEPVRLSFWGRELEEIARIDSEHNRVRERLQELTLYPAKIFVTPAEQLERAIRSIEAELEERLAELRAEGKWLEAQRLEQRTRFDIEMMREIGYCSGIENYSRHLSGRAPGQRPYCLFDYFPPDYLLIIDESHITIPQIRGMYNGDISRKRVLVEHGFRLPSALDNRPLRFDEFESLINQVIFVSATPGPYELEKCGGVVVEQIIRPTGILDPEVEVRPTKGQIEDLMNEIRAVVARGERALVTTLTKRMAEDLTDYLVGFGFRVRYLHSEIDALERVDILRDLRLGEFDVLIGINLLREGLDLPEVALVAILDADKEGFLRSERALIQIAGRAARNAAGRVILYADRLTEAMSRMIEEVRRRRAIQQAYNERHGIIPRTVRKTPQQILQTTAVADHLSSRQERRRYYVDPEPHEVADPLAGRLSEEERQRLIAELRRQMQEAIQAWEFERAAELRDAIRQLELAGAGH
jgi:excinuclease ABC subunit B|nr:MAG: UvrABC system protein B [Bacteroidota bacterium]